MICKLCPNNCGVDRQNKAGFCGTGDNIRIAKFYLHKFEEPVISGTKGSGTVFFCGCSLKCVFCQNYEISRNQRGKDITINELAEIFYDLETQGAHNINLVNPTHYSDKILRAFEIYTPKIPIVYNTHGYEHIDVLQDICKYVNVFLPDIKYFSENLSGRYCGKKDYFKVASKAIEFMANKPYIIGEDGTLKSGTIVRHLVLPLGVNDSKKILDWFSTIKDNAYINVMSQYTPFGEISAYPELKRKITKREYESVINYALSLGITNMFYQAYESASKEYIPSWDY